MSASRRGLAAPERLPQREREEKRRSGDHEDKEEARRLAEARRIPIPIYVMIFAGIAALFVFCFKSQDPERLFAALFMYAGGSLCLGLLIGFLFGIPKSRTDVARSFPEAIEVRPEEKREPYQDNTNLEEVSDWLTKIIVGIGLAQFNNILDLIRSISNELADISEIGSVGRVLGGGAVVYFAVLGFLYGYLWARIRFLDVLLIPQRALKPVLQDVSEIKTKQGEVLDSVTVLDTVNVYNEMYDALRDRIIGIRGNRSQLAALNSDIRQRFQANPRDRRAAILLARYRSEVEHSADPLRANEAAIAVLDRFIAAKQAANEIDRDFSDGLFNRAGYRTRILRDVEWPKALHDPDKGQITSVLQEARVVELLRKINDDLTSAIAAFPAQVADILEDPDFKFLLETEELARQLPEPVRPGAHPTGEQPSPA